MQPLGLPPARALAAAFCRLPLVISADTGSPDSLKSVSYVSADTCRDEMRVAMERSGRPAPLRTISGCSGVRPGIALDKTPSLAHPGYPIGCDRGRGCAAPLHTILLLQIRQVLRTCFPTDTPSVLRNTLFKCFTPTPPRTSSSSSPTPSATHADPPAFAGDPCARRHPSGRLQTSGTGCSSDAPTTGPDLRRGFRPIHRFSILAHILLICRHRVLLNGSLYARSRAAIQECALHT